MVLSLRIILEIPRKSYTFVTQEHKSYNINILTSFRDTL